MKPWEPKTIKEKKQVMIKKKCGLCGATLKGTLRDFSRHKEIVHMIKPIFGGFTFVS